MYYVKIIFSFLLLFKDYNKQFFEYIYFFIINEMDYSKRLWYYYYFIIIINDIDKKKRFKEIRESKNVHFKRGWHVSYIIE